MMYSRRSTTETAAPTCSTDVKPLLLGPRSKFRWIPPNSAINHSQVAENEGKSRKMTAGTFAEKISPAQRSQLVEWLADHTYDEVCELVAADAPAGFGIEVGKTTLCRFYKVNFREIDAL